MCFTLNISDDGADTEAETQEEKAGDPEPEGDGDTLISVET